jgi:hypothetical protein
MHPYGVRRTRSRRDGRTSQTLLRLTGPAMSRTTTM